MRWAGHVASTGEMRNAFKKPRSENLKERDHSEELVIYGRISESILGTKFIWIRIRTRGGLL
jgi:hypothetical protein